MTCRTDATAGRRSVGACPTAGRVGMRCLIIAESAIFTIFVVAYVYYLGKNADRPAAAATCSSLPIFISLSPAGRAASPSVAVRALRRGSVRRLHGCWWLRRSSSARSFSTAPALEWHRLIVREGPHHPDEPLRDDVLLAGRPARLPRDRRHRAAADRRWSWRLRRVRCTASTRSRTARPRHSTGTSSTPSGWSCSRSSTSSGAEGDGDEDRPLEEVLARAAEERRPAAPRRPGPSSLAFGATLLTAGLVTHVSISVVGALR